MILVREYPCNHCDESHQYFLDFTDDGQILWRYEGCGGLMGRNAESDGKEISAKEAVELLRARRSELWGRINEFQCDLRSIVDVIEELLMKK